MPITPYTGTFGTTQLRHLLRRTLFGVTKADLAAFSGQTMAQVVSGLLNPATPNPLPPVVDYTGDPNITQGTTWVDGPSDNNYQSQRQQSIRGWWIGLMVNQNRDILEKMTLFWHNHAPTDLGNPNEAIYCYRYNKLLRDNALGNFKTFIRQLTLDAAMLYYLDGRNNSRTAPNENYARELQELFTVGKDTSPYYTEADVQAAAKVLTGWRVNTADLIQTVYFDSTRHDTASKTFSSFYGGTIIAGTGWTNAGYDELDALLNMIFAKDEVAKYIVRKLYRFFVYYKIDSTVEANVIVPLADLFRTGPVGGQPYDIKPVMEALLTSDHFYQSAQIGCMIKNPIDYVVGFARVFNVDFPAASDPNNQYRNWRYLHDSANTMQMRIGNAPNVAGWPAYYQEPNFHELWVNSETLRKRKEFTDRLITSNFNGSNMDVIAFTATLSSPADPNLLIDEVIQLVHIIDSDSTIKTQLKSILLSGQAADFYWTDAWNAYLANPTTSNTNTVKNRLNTFYQAIVGMAEYLLH